MPEPIFWSRAGSDADWTSPIIGTPGVAPSTGSYDTGRFGNGTKEESAATTNAPKLAVNTFSVGYCTITFWYKHTVAFGANNGFFGLVSGTSYLDMNERGTSGSGNFRLIIDAKDSAGGRSAYNFLTVDPDADTWWDLGGDFHHYAVIIDGSASATNRIRFFRDNVEINYSHISVDGSMNSNLLNQQTWVGANGAPNSMRGIMDNLKIWNQPYTNFDNRFDERGDLNDQQAAA